MFVVRESMWLCAGPSSTHLAIRICDLMIGWHQANQADSWKLLLVLRNVVIDDADYGLKSSQ